MKKVSILFPVYNTPEPYLREAIESILNQTFQDFELLILNDASPDKNVEKVVQSYTDKRIRYEVNASNMGISATRNKLIDLAKGEYLAVMDHDDISLPARLEKQVAFLDAHPEVGVIGAKVETIPSGKLTHYPSSSQDIKIALVQSCAITHSVSMIRKSVLLENNIRYRGEYSPAEDYALWCELIPYTEFHNLPDVLLQYRLHADNTSKKQNKKMDDATMAIHAFMQTQNPILYQLFQMRATQTSRIRLFGFIPFLTMKTKGNRSKVLLFEKIPLLTYKKAVKLGGIK